METRRVQPRTKEKSKRMVRVSISLPEAHYTDLESIAQNFRVSLSWVVRDAIQKYLKIHSPLLADKKDLQINKSEDE